MVDIRNSLPYRIFIAFAVSLIPVILWYGGIDNNTDCNTAHDVKNCNLAFQTGKMIMTLIMPPIGFIIAFYGLFHEWKYNKDHEKGKGAI